MNREEKVKFESWLVKQPYSIQLLAKRYPPGTYIVRPNAPYNISTEGTIVFITGEYKQDGTVEVMITPDCKLPSTLAWEREQAKKMNYNKKQIQALHQQPAYLFIDPIWLSKLPTV